MAVYFDGTDDYIWHPSGFSTYSSTFACWVKIHAYNVDMRGILILNRSSGAFHGEYFQGLTCGFDNLAGGGPSDANRFCAVSYISSTSYTWCSSTTSRALDTWYHVAATFNGTWNRAIYVNAVQEAVDNTVKTVQGTRMSYAAIQRYSGVSRHFNISIAEPCFWMDAELTEDELAAIYTGDARPYEVRPDKLLTWSRFITTPPQGVTEVPSSITVVDSPVSVEHPPIGTRGPIIG